MDNKGLVVAVFMDVSKAFDCVSQGCQSQISSGPKLSSEVKSLTRLNVY